MKSRDYQAEYVRRIASGLAHGFSRGQSAGHPCKGEPYISECATTDSSSRNDQKGGQ